ncbi:MAG TPA: extracellular matrix/biofilm biosynthesis regulator RemA family protein [Bacillota bacterium]
MFIHLGGDTLISSKDIIAIISVENVSDADCRKVFLKGQDQKEIKRIDSENCKSIIITDKKIYLSPISTLTLKKRAEFLNEIALKS